MIRLKKCSLIWLTLLLLLIATAVNAAEKNFVEIDIYSVNDFHGHPVSYTHLTLPTKA